MHSHAVVLCIFMRMRAPIQCESGPGTSNTPFVAVLDTVLANHAIEFFTAASHIYGSCIGTAQYSFSCIGSLQYSFSCIGRLQYSFSCIGRLQYSFWQACQPNTCQYSINTALRRRWPPPGRLRAVSIHAIHVLRAQYMPIRPNTRHNTAHRENGPQFIGK